MTQTIVDAEKVDTFRADERGRIYLGPEYKDSEVEVAVIGKKEEIEE